MDLNRRSVLRKASALSALAVGASGFATAADCSSAPAWDETVLYSTGDQVQHPDGDGIDALWEAELDSRNAEPSRSSSYWNYVGDCDGSGGGSNSAPTASFTTSISNPEPGENVSFDGSGSSDSDGSISSYSWDFGDGSSGSGQSVSHSYSSSGDYTVTLTVTDDDGATDSASQTVSVSSGSSNSAPTASFTVSPSSPTMGESATFDAADSSDSDGSISSYSWDFGDGSTATGQSVTHSYSSTGDYTVTLTVTDDDGATDSNATTVTVQSSSSGGACDGVSEWQSDVAYSGGDQVTHDGSLWTAEWWTKGTEPAESENVWTLEGACDGDGGGGGGNESPTASFTSSPYAPAPDETVTFDAADSSDADGSISSYSWDFGDGSSGSGQSVTHSYGSTGDYTVTLTVTDDDGATATDSTTVSVETDSGGGSGTSTFAPYNHMTTQPGTSLVDHYNQASNDAFTLAFVLSDGNGNAAWDGAPDQLVGEFGLASEIQDYQDTGGEVIISFGGAVGTMIAQDTTDIAKIKSEYEKVMDTYGVTHLDFDIESVNQDAVDRRNQALAELQSERSDLNVSYTLRCRTTGLTSHGTYVVESARDHGVDLQYVNIMTMNYGWVEPSASTVKDSANGTHSDLQEIFSGISSDEAWSMLGVTPMIGENNSGGAHHLDDAQEVATFVQNKGIGLVSFWSIDRDNGSCSTGTVSATCSGVQQSDYEFSGIYNDVQ
ncbi:PKD domain-containing protein [Salinarchaeum sp. Harcht-Bsk1]|uniref:PKD domain-containing protein n=1 Tax=Salinarchaeum sp. Harcht-Bsk1 TaxID=1333523 RepID=UPI000342310E|nr:PKD domain-containing protein [Salinarchaeum sp. Harcht-Bsk1]AGN02078.1 PKD domain-containing protein [Salinarchaeum sp. Harcht-Bsk1]